MTKPPGAQAYQLLAIDDNELNLGLFRLLLTQLGHKVTGVNNPFDAIELVKQEAFDLVFTDIQMPGMTGIEASKKMREHGFTGPIIAITAHLSNLEELEIETSAINDVLFKPISQPDLIQVIQQWLDDKKDGSVTRRRDTDTPIEARAREPRKSERPAVAPRLYDVDIALSRANESPELATEMLHLLIESLPEAMDGLSSNKGKNDPAALAQTLHKLAGGVLFSGATQLEAELEQLRHLLQQAVQQGTFREANVETNIEANIEANIETRIETGVKALENAMQALTEWALEHPTPFN